MIWMQMSYCKEVRHAMTSQTGCAGHPASCTLHHVIIRGIERKEIVKNDWQDRDFVLKWFGGGLIKSQGGWSAVKALKSGSRRRKITIV
jgi:hypothetical protein